MRIGISVCSNYRHVEAREGARFMIERGRAARAANLDSLFVGDHHVTPTNYYQNTAILGRMLAEWGDKPAGALYLLPLWHPVLLAEQIATLACIAQGKFIMQCGLGGDPAQSAGMGIDFSKRVGMFEDALHIMRALWAGESVDHERYWPLVDARIQPLPPEPIDVWVGSTAPPALRRTARMAQGWLGSPGTTLQESVAQLNQYRQACAEFDRTPSAVAVRRDIFIAPTSQAAAAFKEKVVSRGYRGFSEEAMVAGSVDEVADTFAGFAEAGFTDIIVRNMSQDQAEALGSIERLARVKEQFPAASM
ncbi:MAG: LLM class flavin-dependent oxidoreductase [Pseudomonadota bacterium]